MEKLENKTIYKCSYCDKISLSAGGMSSHERSCKNNPNRCTPCASCEYLERTDEERKHTQEDCDRCYHNACDGDCIHSYCVKQFKNTTFTCKKTGKKMYYARKVERMAKYRREAIISKCDCPMPQQCNMYKEQRYEQSDN